MKTGQKLICLKSAHCTWFGISMSVIKGEFYTYAGPAHNVGYIMTKETGEWGVLSDIMRPVDDTFGEVVAEIIEKQIEVEEMETV